MLRVGVLIIMEICLIYDRYRMPLWVSNLMLFATLVIIVINVILLRRIIQSDVVNASDLATGKTKDVMNWQQ